ncbi:SPOR domain-containing protein [Microbulbifer harenosus]|uniref:SPOR domain-containing protein n=1 Tax=Microbulbifer harenosus TaxID=2576840 RepID=A0ABY2UDK3_9GAMM|nr:MULTISPECIES: hypothetical protein [Microbulbifer]QIL91442.1 hypothetical protein GNX18_17880 [Microbulbifer sp. SH-1]TLM74744.1 hypothetical protein FDY93_17040 [Microbulbifer harenosus]
MRWIFLFLAAANLGLLAWFVTTTSAPAPTAKSVPLAEEEGAGSIILLSEADPAQLRAGKQKPAAAPSDTPAERADTPPAQLCSLVGPFDEAYQGEEVARRLQALQVPAAMKEIEMQGQMRYWVYLAPLNSSQQAFRKLRELQAAGIDSYVIPKGSLENGISFGIFSEEERARSLARDLQGRGFAAEYREEPQTYLERWVVVESTGVSQVAEAFWQQLQLDYPDIGRRQNLCSEIREKEIE